LSLGFDTSSSDPKSEPMVLNMFHWTPEEPIPDSSKHIELTVPKATKEILVQAKKQLSVTKVREGVFELSSATLKLLVEDGVITSLYDKTANREVIAEGQKANQFVIFDDKPLYWQAWDVEVYHLESRKELSSSKSYISFTTSERVSVVTETEISADSWLKSTISLDASASMGSGSMVIIETEVEWRETMKFLKVEFPVDIVNTEASYECQFGIVKRPTHYNTSWDMAKFEVCCHKWADLSEAGYGVSILNDSKYGFATTGSMMRLSLLRAPKAPDAHADMGKSLNLSKLFSVDIDMYKGRHHIRYAIFPHTGPLDHRTVHAGYGFNSPPRTVRHVDRLNTSAFLGSFRIIGAPNLIIDTVKRGDDDADISVDNLPTRKTKNIIIRLFDSLGGKSTGKLTWGKIPVKKVYETNLLEDDGKELELAKDGHSVSITVKPFEVVTVRLEL
jgi:alpha-mannosidase